MDRRCCCSDRLLLFSQSIPIPSDPSRFAFMSALSSFVQDRFIQDRMNVLKKQGEGLKKALDESKSEYSSNVSKPLHQRMLKDLRYCKSAIDDLLGVQAKKQFKPKSVSLTHQHTSSPLMMSNPKHTNTIRLCGHLSIIIALSCLCFGFSLCLCLSRFLSVCASLVM